MRTDLSATFQAHIQADGNSPRQYLIFHFDSFGDVYLSDADHDGLDTLVGATISPIVEDWGELSDMAGGNPEDQAAGETRQLSITLWNGGSWPFSDYFLLEDPENVEVDLYQWFAGLSESVLIDRFVCQDPIEYDEASYLLKLDMVSRDMKYNPPIGELLTEEDWPDAHPEDIGKAISIAFGGGYRLNTLRAKIAPEAQLNGAITEYHTTIKIAGQTVVGSFASSGVIEIGYEKIRYTGYASNQFTGCTRGYSGTDAEVHDDKTLVSQVITDHTFVVCKGPIYGMSAPQVDGFADMSSSAYTIYNSTNPARIVFNRKPYHYYIADTPKKLTLRPNSIHALNTARYPYRCYDSDPGGKGAKIDSTDNRLAVVQAADMPDLGQITRAEIVVIFYANQVYSSDNIHIWVHGADYYMDDIPRPISTDNEPTRPIEIRRDLSGYIEDSNWDYFEDLWVDVAYSGYWDPGTIIAVTEIRFEIEYRPRQIQYSDQVSVYISGGIKDDASGTYSGAPYSLFRRPDQVRAYLLAACGGYPIADIDSTTKAAIAAQYNALGYQINGVLDGNLTVREAEKKVAFQTRSRFFYNAGKAKFALRQKQAGFDHDTARALTTANLRLRSIHASRKKVDDLTNKITLLYKRDWTEQTTGKEAYKKSITVQNSGSISRHGIREKRENWEFDLVRNSGMASDLADYYLESASSASVFYNFETYLEQFGLEKEDHITLTTAWNRLGKAPMMIRSINRQFASGKKKSINILKICAVCFGYNVVRILLAETVTAYDQLQIEVGLNTEANWHLITTDEQIFAVNVGEQETIEMVDVIDITAAWFPEYQETITPTDALDVWPTVNLADSVEMRAPAENVYFLRVSYGFGSGEFGNIGFGGTGTFADTNPDDAHLFEQMFTDYTLALQDSASIQDEKLFQNWFGGDGWFGFGQGFFGGNPNQEQTAADSAAMSDNIGAALTLLIEDGMSIAGEPVWPLGFGSGQFGYEGYG